MSRNRRLIYRKRRRMRYILDHSQNVSHMYYKGKMITFVDIPEKEMPEAIAEIKSIIDGENENREKND